MTFLVGRDLYDAHVETFTGNASTTAFTLANSTTTNACVVRINGVVQRNGTDFTVSGDTITFTTAPPNASNNVVVQYFGVGTLQVPTDASVTEAKLGSDSVSEAKLKVSNSPTNGTFLQAQSGASGGLTWAEAGAILQVKQFTKTSSVDVGTNNDDLVLFAPFDGSATITPAVAGNMIIIDYMATIDHGVTWRSAKNRIEYSTDGGSNYKAIVGGSTSNYNEVNNMYGTMIAISCMFNPNTTNAVKVRVIHNAHNSGHGRLYTYNGENSTDTGGTGSNDTDTVGGVKAVTTAMRLTEVVASASTLSTTA